MIITSDNIRQYRQIAKNIAEERIAIYIRETLTFDLMPVVGASLMQKYNVLDAATLDTSTVEDAEQLGLTREEYTYLMGGTWVDAQGVTRSHTGLREAACYFAYARFVRNHATQTTPFGVVVKDGEESQAATQQMIAAISRDAQVIAEQVLRDATEYWKSVSDNVSNEPNRRQRHFVAVGE